MIQAVLFGDFSNGWSSRNGDLTSKGCDWRKIMIQALQGADF